jgi:hypothetical protein
MGEAVIYADYVADALYQHEDSGSLSATSGYFCRQSICSAWNFLWSFSAAQTLTCLVVVPTFRSVLRCGERNGQFISNGDVPQGLVWCQANMVVLLRTTAGRRLLDCTQEPHYLISTRMNIIHILDQTRSKDFRKKLTKSLSDFPCAIAAQPHFPQNH